MKTTRPIIWLALSVSGFLAAQAATVPPPSLNSEYAAILRSGDARKLREALDHGASARARDAARNTPLMHAAVYGDVPRGDVMILKLLIGPHQGL